MQPFPSITQRLVDTVGVVLEPFISYFRQFTIAPPSFMNIIVGVSPFSYEAVEPGNLAITGGTISQITLNRGSDTISFGAGTNKFIPVGIADTITITYTVLPTINFIPSYGQNTTN